MVAWRCRFAVALTVALTMVHNVRGAAECCSTCIGKTAESVYDYDPTIYEQCRLSPNGARVCCFECGTWGEPQYGDSISFASDGTTPQVKAGTWISMKWTTATKVTYITLKDGQKKINTPTLNDSAAKLDSGFFMICATSKGSVVIRGWGEDTCRQASSEKTIEIIEGEEGATCSSAAPVAPTTTTVTESAGSDEDEDIANCNLTRATVKTVDGKKQCVCVSDWAGAPACDQMPVWKWLITIGGGLAALFSIVISVRAFMQSQEKKKKQQQEREDMEMELATPHLGAKDDVEILRIGADRASPNIKQASYKRNDDIYKIHDRECSL